jgi:hypothetical protein
MQGEWGNAPTPPAPAPAPALARPRRLLEPVTANTKREGAGEGGVTGWWWAAQWQLGTRPREGVMVWWRG